MIGLVIGPVAAPAALVKVKEVPKVVPSALVAKAQT
jgi:hypothetical protein